MKYLARRPILHRDRELFACELFFEMACKTLATE